jgi:hypothetical protein
MPERLVHEGDLVEILPATAPPPGQPAAPRPHGVVAAVDHQMGRATVRVQGRRFPLELSLQQLRRLH